MKRWIDKKPEVKKLKKWEAAWLAGAIDGEGSIGLYDYGKEGRRVMIQIANSNFKFLEFAKKIIGCGSLHKRNRNSPSHWGKKIIQQYGLKGSNRCYHLLRQIIPFLIIKKQKALDIIKELEEKPFGRWANATPAYKRLHSERAKIQWQNPVIRKNRVLGMRKYYKLKLEKIK